MEDSSILRINKFKTEDNGEYTCEATNRLKIAQRSTELKVISTRTFFPLFLSNIQTPWLIAIFFVLLLLNAVTIYLCCRARQPKMVLVFLR